MGKECVFVLTNSEGEGAVEEAETRVVLKPLLSIPHQYLSGQVPRELRNSVRVCVVCCVCVEHGSSFRRGSERVRMAERGLRSQSTHVGVGSNPTPDTFF